MARPNILVLALALFLAASPTRAQDIEVPRDMYENRLNREGQAISFCYHDNPMMADFHRDVAEAIARALLIEPKIIPIAALRPAEALDYRIPFDSDELFLMLNGRCSAFLGFTLTTDYPEWLLVSRPYFSSTNVLVVNDPQYRRLEDIPVDRPLGTRIFSSEDSQLAGLISALPENKRWNRFPYRNYGIALERAIDGSVGGSVVWEAGVYSATDGDPEAAGISIRELPFATSPIQLGLGIRSNERYLELMLSQAIEALSTDGTLIQLAIKHHLAPPTSGVPSADT